MIQTASLVVPRAMLPLGVVGPVWELRTGPTDSICLASIILSFTPGANVVIGIGIGTPASRGINPSNTSNLMVQDDPAVNLGGVTVATSWSTNPTIPVNFIRRMTASIQGVAAVGPFLFSLDRVLQPSSSLVLWVITASLTTSGAAGTGVETSFEISQ